MKNCTEKDKEKKSLYSLYPLIALFFSIGILSIQG